MKRYLLYILIIMNLSCVNSIKTKGNKSIKKGKKVFFLNYDLTGNIKIYFNGILMTKINEREGVRGGNYYLNSYINKSGIQSISVKLDKFHNKFLFPAYLEGIFLEVYYSNNFSEGMNDFHLEKIKKLVLPKYEDAQDSIFYTWELTTDVNYELPNVLENATDLSKEDTDKLFKDVISFYTNIHEVLNNGQTDKYRDIFKESLTRQAKSMYYNEQEIQNYITEQVDRAAKAEGFMQPFENYTLELHINNKTLELVSISNGKSPLVSIDKDNYIRTEGFILYKDKTTGKLEVY